MGLGDAEVDINHNYSFGFCAECRRRGINNRTEVSFFANSLVCGSCKKFLRGELECDIPELKLYVSKQGFDTLPPSIQARAALQQQPLQPTQPITPVDSSTIEMAEWLARNSDEALRKEITECILSDKESLYSVLIDHRYFSLRELKKHAERLGKRDQPEVIDGADYAAMVLKSQHRKKRKPRTKRTIKNKPKPSLEHEEKQDARSGD